MFDWENWLLSCGACNQKKWTRFPDCDGEPCLLDPTRDDPEMHLAFEEARIVGRSKRGVETIGLVKLDRSPLTDRRAQWLNYIRTLLLVLIRIPEAKDAARALLIWAMQEEAPHSAMTRCFLRSKSPRLAQPAQPDPHVSPENPIAEIRTLVELHAEQLAEIV